MITFLAALCGGLVSAAITLFLGQPLQHYFWTRQRHAERQLVLIDEVRQLGAELQFLVWHNPEEIGARHERLKTAFLKAATNVESLFSRAASDTFLDMSGAMEAVMDLRKKAISPQQRSELNRQLMGAFVDTVAALYRDIGIPAPTLDQWFHAQVWQPLRTRVWDHPRRYWYERGRPGLQQWAAQVRTRSRRSCASQPRATSDEDRS
jgi:hypothetical protein